MKVRKVAEAGVGSAGLTNPEIRILRLPRLQSLRLRHQLRYQLRQITCLYKGKILHMKARKRKILGHHLGHDPPSMRHHHLT